jgi:hypothetical protein
MPPPKRIIRGVKNIRTRTGAPDQTIVPYKAYMAITALEMETFRRETERDNLLQRLGSVNGRLEAVAAEKALLLRRLGKSPAGRGSRPPIRPARPDREHPSAGQGSGFKLKY